MSSEAEQARPDGRRRGGAALALILGLSLVLNLTGIWWGLPQSGSWAPDEVYPGRVHEAMASLFSRGWFDKYPLFHFMLLTPVVLPVFFLYNAGILHLSPIAGHTLLLLLMRLVSAAMAAGIVYGIFRLGRNLLGRRAGLAAAAVAALIVPFSYYAKTANVDVPYLFWFVLSLNFLVRALAEGRRRDLVLLAVTAALAVSTKDQAYALFAIVPVIVVWNDLKRSRLRNSLPSYGWALAAGAGAFALANNLIFNWAGFVSHVRLITGPASRDFAAFPANVGGQIRLLGLAGKQIRFCLGWPFLIVALAGLAFILFDKSAPAAAKALPLLALSYHALYIGLIRYSYDRFQLPAVLLLAVFAGGAVDRFLGTRKVRWKSWAVAALFGFGLFQAVSVDRLLLADTRYEVERWMRGHVEPTATVGRATNPEYLPRPGNYAVIDLPLSLDAFRGAGKPDYIIFCSKFRDSFGPDTEGSRFFAGFAAVPPGYRRVLDAKPGLRLFPLSFEGIETNLAAISPEIEIYARNDIPPMAQNKIP